MRCPVQSTLPVPQILTSCPPPSSGLAPPSVYQISPPRNYSLVSLWLNLSTWLPGQNRGILGSRGDSEAQWGKHATCGWPFQQMDITSNTWTKLLPLPRAHPAFPHFAVPIPSCPGCQFMSSRVYFCVLQVSRFLSMVATVRDAHAFAIPWPFYLPFWSTAYPDPSAPVSVTRQGLQVHMLQLVHSHHGKNLWPKTDSSYAAAAGKGVGAWWDHDPNSS